jgi:DNA-binding CsgD family transcriptional regulator/ligand-binding sensor domain-containing protein
MRKLINTIFLLLLSISGFAQYPKVRNFSKETYKAGSQTWCITQDHGGNMYFANSGILEFDGLEWSLTQTVNRSSARSLLYDEKSERLYFGAANEFGFIHIDENNCRQYVSLSKDLETNMEDIWAIHIIDDQVWLREQNSIYHTDLQSIKQISFSDKISCSSIIDGRFLIFVNNQGVHELDSDNRFVLLKNTESLKNERVVAILEYKSNPMFVCADGDIYIHQEGKLIPFEHDFKNAAVNATIYCAQTDGRYLALGTVKDGVYIIDLDSEYRIHLNTYSGLQNNTVLSMFFDRDGNLWLGLDKGIDLIQLKSNEYSLFGNSDRFGSGYASAIHNGELWLGTNQGLYHAPYIEGGPLPDDDKFRSVDMVKGQIWSLISYDEVLFCCHDRGIYVIKNGRCRHIQLNGTWKLERLKEWPDYLLGSTYDQLFLLKKESGEWVFDCWIDGFNDASKAFEEDSDGTIWFYHWIKGLFMLDFDMQTKSITDIRFMSKSNGFPEDWSNIPIEVNSKVLFTTTKGFYSYDQYSDHAYPLQRMNSLFATTPESASVYLSPYDYGYFSSSDLQAVTYKDEDGNDLMDSLSLKGLSSKRIPGFEDTRSLSERELLVNTDEGFSIINIENIRKPGRGIAPQVYLKSIYTDNDECIYSALNSQSNKATSLDLDYEDNTLVVTAAYPVYESNNGVEFSFMLEGYDKQWSQFSENNLKEYTRLPHGDYTLKVRARDNLHGNISESSMSIRIDAPWYYSTPAIITYILICILLGILAYKLMYRYSIRHARSMSIKKEKELRRQQMKLDLERKAQDLAASTMNVIRKNEMLLEIDSELEKAVENIVDDRNKSLKILSRIRSQIHENIQHDDAWKTFEENFDIVYNDYLKRLSKNHPQLTVADKKMCAYLKMGLSSKDIAPLLNITVRSVEMTRYRLRKKLGLSREDNLTEFLQKF